jgi:hypothetical protein
VLHHMSCEHLKRCLEIFQEAYIRQYRSHTTVYACNNNVGTLRKEFF